MAENNRATFIVDVVSKGLKVARDSVAHMGQSIRDTASAHRDANKAAGDHYNTQAKGVIGTANSTKSFSKLAETMNNSSGVVGAYATLAANIFAVTAAFNALRSAAQVEQVVAGLEAMGNRMGNTLSIAANNLREISGYTLSTEQAMRSTAQIASSGLGMETIQRIGEAANDTSFALGRNMVDSMDRLTRGIIKLEPELLDELGIMTRIGDATREYANRMGKTEGQLTTFERRQAFANAALAEAEAKFGGLADAAGNTRNLDMLGAAFADLTKEILGLINTAALPLAAILSNKGLMLGAMILFASTISRQLLPGLSNLSEKALASAEAMSQLAKSQAAQIPVLEKGPRFLKVLNDRMRDGTAVATDYAKGLDSANKAILKHESDLARHESGARPLRPSQVADKTEILGVLDAQRDAILRVQEVEGKADSRRRAAASITAAGNGQVALSYKLMASAVADYHREVVIAAAAEQTATRTRLWTTITNGAKMALGSILSVGIALRSLEWGSVGKAASSAFIVARTGAYAASIGIRALGAALLNLIPIIGQVLLVVTLLWDGLKALYSWWQGAAVQNLNKALEEQAEITSKIGARVSEINRVRSSTVSIATKEAAAYNVLTNTISENLEAYEKVAAAQRAVLDESGKNRVAVGGTVEFDTLNTLRNSGLPEIRQQVEDALGKRGLAGVLDDEFRNLTRGELAQLGKVLTEDLAKGAVTLGQSINDLQENFKNAEKVIADFNRSAIPSTPYDELVKGLDGVTNSIMNIAVAAAHSESFVQRMANSFAGVGGGLEKFLSIETQGLLKEYRDLEKTITAAGDNANAQDRTRLGQLQLILAVRSSELFQVQEMVTTAQSALRLTASQVALEQSRLQKLNQYTALTGASIRERREAENNIIRLQAQQLKTQKTLVDTQKSITEIQLRQNELLLTQNTLYQQITASVQGLSQVTGFDLMQKAMQRIIELRAELNSNNGLFDRSDATINTEIDQYTALISQYQTTQNLAAQLRDQRAQSDALSANIAAKLNEQTAQSVINAEAAAVNARTHAENQQKVNEAAQERNNLENTYAQIQDKVNGRVASFVDEYNRLIRAQTAQGQVQKNSLVAQTEANIRNMMLEQARANGNAGEVAAYDRRIAQERELLGIKLEQIDANNLLEIYDRFAFNTQKEGLEMQQQSLEYLERAVQGQRELSDQLREQRSLGIEIARKRVGLRETEEQNQRNAIIEARDAYELAVREANLRKATIGLEFALLEGQRQQTIFNLQAQQQIVGAQTDMGRQLGATVENLRNAADYVNQARDAALRGVDVSIENARRRLQSASLPEGTRDSTGQNLRDFIALRREQRRGLASAANENFGQTGDAEIRTYVAPIVDSNQRLLEATKDLAAVNREWIDRLDQSLKRVDLQAVGNTIQDAAKAAVAEGFRVSEMNGYGGVRPVHKGRGHYEGRAFDMNIGSGNVEWNNPQMKARMDAMAEQFRAQGYKVLWGVKDHFDHMHVEMVEGAAKIAQATSKAVINVVEVPLRAAENKIESIITTSTTPVSTTAANDNQEVVVTGKSVMPRDFQTLIGAFERLSSTGEFNMVSVFENMAQSLGPQGEIVPQIITGINSIAGAYENLKLTLADSASTGADKFEAYTQVAQQALSTISGILQSNADARTQAIEREIAVEQKRDGKSAESIAKIEALERRRDSIQRKAFNTNKKVMMAQAIIATAAGVAQALTLGPIAGPIMAAVIGALGAAQLAIISGTSYQSTANPGANSATPPSTLTIGRRGDSVDLARHNPNVGGELGYLRGARGRGTNAANYNVIGSAYGGNLPRGYGNTAYAVGEKGPEIITRETPINVTPVNDNNSGNPLNATFNIQAFDGQSVYDMLHDQRGNLIGMLREAANANGGRFMEDVNVSVYSKSDRRAKRI